METSYKLTDFSRAGGCGCKLAVHDLNRVLQDVDKSILDKHLVVGNETRDDAAAYDIGNGQTVLSTTDFFTPIVDDAYDFGTIAAVNALSDIYAMGGKPIMALAILGWPAQTLPLSVASQVMAGAQNVCRDAQVALCGGHSINSSEPFFGLAVTGLCPLSSVKKNSSATTGSYIYLTKPLGVGILTTALKQKKLNDEDYQIAAQSMKELNSIGSDFASCTAVCAMTDVTGFGFFTHLYELCEASKLSVCIGMLNIPCFANLKSYISTCSQSRGSKCNSVYMADKIQRHHESYTISNENKSKPINCMYTEDEMYQILNDPQTSGGLLVAVNPQDPNVHHFHRILQDRNLELHPIGVFVQETGKPLVHVYDSFTV